MTKLPSEVIRTAELIFVLCVAVFERCAVPITHPKGGPRGTCPNSCTWWDAGIGWCNAKRDPTFSLNKKKSETGKLLCNVVNELRQTFWTGHLHISLNIFPKVYSIFYRSPLQRYLSAYVLPTLQVAKRQS